MNNNIKTPEEIIKSQNKDYDFYVSHTFNHWVRDLEDYERFNKLYNGCKTS
jgi:hypothetical protein